jgi:hypothetical protein
MRASEAQFRIVQSAAVDCGAMPHESMMSPLNTAAVEVQSSGQATAEPARRGRALGWLATAAIMVALLIMIAASLLRSSWMPPALDMPRFGPPWELSAHVSARAIVVALWAAGLLAAAGVVAGLVAVRRGMPLPVKTLMVTALLGVAALVVLPPVGSTDPLDYAIYGQIVAHGHSPYLMTPYQYKLLVHLRDGVPLNWEHNPTVYGPLATAEQFVMAKIAGLSLARTVFWIKLVNGIAFAVIAFAADRMLRGNRAARLRALMLWTANPLIIWSLIAGGHLDVLAAGCGVAGLLVLDRWATGQPLVRALVAGLCIGAAADIKADYVLFGLGAAWVFVLRKEIGQLLAAAAGGLLILVPSYAIAGVHAIKALTARASVGIGYEFYGLIFHHIGISPVHFAVPVAVCLMIPISVLALNRLPDGMDGQPFVRAALAISIVWLLVWPHQFAWYSVIAISLLVFFPASRLDWLAVAWLSAITIADIPGLGRVPITVLGHYLSKIQTHNLDRYAPLVMLAALIGLVVLCLNRNWNARGNGQGLASLPAAPSS